MRKELNMLFLIRFDKKFKADQIREDMPIALSKMGIELRESINVVESSLEKRVFIKMPFSGGTLKQMLFFMNYNEYDVMIEQITNNNSEETQMKIIDIEELGNKRILVSYEIDDHEMPPVMGDRHKLTIRTGVGTFTFKIMKPQPVERVKAYSYVYEEEFSIKTNEEKQYLDSLAPLFIKNGLQILEQFRE